MPIRAGRGRAQRLKMLRGPLSGAGDARGITVGRCGSIIPDAEKCVGWTSSMIGEPGRRFAREDRRQGVSRFDFGGNVEQRDEDGSGNSWGLGRHPDRFGGNDAATDWLGRLGVRRRDFTTAGRLIFNGATRANRHNSAGGNVCRAEESAPGMHSECKYQYPSDHTQSLRVPVADSSLSGNGPI